ncbi:hypothetical protein [Kitasatospora sp. NPDC015120]|uniref:hypothetical protein n=1 Tax=Kitasatospora sp. NPDC015120 TaxID=3364023 RepID=UPI0036F4A186
MDQMLTLAIERLRQGWELILRSIETGPATGDQVVTDMRYAPPVFTVAGDDDPQVQGGVRVEAAAHAVHAAIQMVESALDVPKSARAHPALAVALRSLGSATTCVSGIILAEHRRTTRY